MLDHGKSVGRAAEAPAASGTSADRGTSAGRGESPGGAASAHLALPPQGTPDLLAVHPACGATYRCVQALPGHQGNRLQLHHGAGFGPSQFVGLKNYRLLLTNPSFETVLLNNLKLVVAIPFFVVVPLLVAVILFERPWGYPFLRAAYFFPAILSPVIVGVMFEELLTTSGPVDGFIRLFDPGFSVTWLVLPGLALWTGGRGAVGLDRHRLLHSRGLSTAPLEMFDAAKIDGAGRGRRSGHYRPGPAQGHLVGTVILTITSSTTRRPHLHADQRRPWSRQHRPGVRRLPRCLHQGDDGHASAVAVVPMIITGFIVAVQSRSPSGGNSERPKDLVPNPGDVIADLISFTTRAPSTT